MIRPAPLSPRTGSDGFTLIELVSVLVLIGILAAVAVPKYFDMQEEAEAKVCAQNRAIALSAINAQLLAAMVDNDTSVFDYSSRERAAAAADTVIGELGRSGRALCPADGTYTAEAAVEDDTYSFAVFCDKHHPKTGNAGSGGSTGGTSGVSREHPEEFIDWIQRVYKTNNLKDLKNDQGTSSKYADLYTFFNTWRPPAEIDSEAGISDTTTSYFVNQALKESGVDTGSIVWRMTKENGADGRTSTVVVTIADKTDVSQIGNGLDSNSTSSGTVRASQYRLGLSYDSSGNPRLSVSEVLEKDVYVTKVSGDNVSSRTDYFRLKVPGEKKK